MNRFEQISQKIIDGIDTLEGKYNPEHDLDVDFASVDYKILCLVELLRDYCDEIYRELLPKQPEEDEAKSTLIVHNVVDDADFIPLEKHEEELQKILLTIDGILKYTKDDFDEMSKTRLQCLQSSLKTKLSILFDPYFIVTEGNRYQGMFKLKDSVYSMGSPDGLGDFSYSTIRFIIDQLETGEASFTDFLESIEDYPIALNHPIKTIKLNSR